MKFSSIRTFECAYTFCNVHAFSFPISRRTYETFFVILPNHQEDYYKSSPTSKKRVNKECRFLWLVNELSCMLQQLQYINDLLKNVMLIFPQYCLGLGLMEMSRNQLYSDAFKKFGQYFIHLYTNLFYIYTRKLFAKFLLCRWTILMDKVRRFWIMVRHQ